MSEFESFEDVIDDITLIQVAENVIHTEAQLNIRSSDNDTGDFGNFDIKLLTASFELDNITDEEKTDWARKKTSMLIEWTWNKRWIRFTYWCKG